MVKCNYVVDGTCDTTREQKFAELIVRECAHAADYVSSPGLSEGEVIKRHFGVEE
jgi:hypothetical protein